MDILTYLIELLQQSNTVGLTGLGTFHKKKFPGRYDKDKQSFLPPGFTLEFTTEVKENQKLSAFVSRKRNISEGSSQYYVSQFVEETNKQLEIEHEANLEGLGRLFFTEHNGLSFEPAERVQYGSEFFGLPNLSEPEKKAASETHTFIPVSVEDQPAPTPLPAKDTPPVVENIELDEVNTDVEHTPVKDQPVEAQKTQEIVLEVPPVAEAFTAPVVVETPSVPEPVVPESPVASAEVEKAPEFIQEQHAEHPNRFGHQPESETVKTYIPLDPPVEDKPVETVVEAPEFIKEQHAEHPDRFGHDPALDVYEERRSPIWPKIVLILLILFILAALLYYFKPGLFNGTTNQNNAVTAVKDTAALSEDTVGTMVSTPQSKQDSAAKTDSTLRVNQIRVKQPDTLKKPVAVAAAKPKTATPVVASDAPKPEITTFEIIGASFETVKGAENFIREARAKGIKARIVKIHGPRKHVSLGSFQSEKEARDQLSILEKKLDGEGFYVQQLINTTP